MMDWWQTLPLMKQFFFTIAVPATVILLIQSVMSIMGLGSDGGEGEGPMDGMSGDLDEDALEEAIDGSGFRFFTIRGIVAFVSVFGWTGAAVTGSATPVLVFLTATGAGLSAMLLVALAFWGILQLQGKGNLDYRYSIGLQGEVYLPVPPERGGTGKVNVTIQERLVEVDAMTDEPERLPTGSRVRVVGLLGNNVLLVSKEWEGHPHAT